MERSNCCRSCRRDCSGGGGRSSGGGGGAGRLFVWFIDSNLRLSHGVDYASGLVRSAGDVGERDGLLHRLGERSLLEHWSCRG